MPEPEYWAWKCEECGRWMDGKAPPTKIFVKEPGPTIHGYDYLERAYEYRVMVVCETCRDTMRNPK